LVLLLVFGRSNEMWVKKNEKGQAIYLIVFGIIALISSAALAIDGGRIYLDRRQVQNTSDSAALAAALAGCSGGDFLQQARNVASLNGYDYLNPTVQVTVNNPPTSGVHTGDPDYFEVIIQAETEVGLAQIVRSGPFPVEGRAVSLCEQSTGGTQAVGEGNAIILLEPSNTGLIMNGGGPTTKISVPDGGIQVDSSNFQAILINGTADIEADVTNIVGDYRINGSGSITPPPITGAPVMGDPLADLEPPENPYTGGCSTVVLNGGDNTTLSPGLYCQVIHNGNGNIYLNPGTYAFTGSMILNGSSTLEAPSGGVELLFFNGSTFQMNGNHNVSLEESFIYIQSGALTLNGGDHFTITAPTSGQWAGMALFMKQTNSQGVTMNGGNNFTVQGTFYAPASRFIFDGATSATVVNAQFIVNDMIMNGGNDLTVNYIPGVLYQVPWSGSSAISLVE
jgi:hypothetical protein